MKNKLTHDMVHEMVQRYNGPEKSKPANGNGSAQSEAIRALISQARARNSRALASRNNGGAVNGINQRPIL